MTGNIWDGQQSPPGSGANVPPEFNIQTGCRCKQNESDVVKGRPYASSAWCWYCDREVNAPFNQWRVKRKNTASIPLPLVAKLPFKHIFLLSMLGHMRLTPTKEGVGHCLLSSSYSSDLEHVLLWNYLQHGSWKEHVRHGRPVFGTSAWRRKHKWSAAAAAAAEGKQRRKSPKSRPGAGEGQPDSRCGASQRLKIILWLDGTKSQLIGHSGQKYDDL